MGKTRRLRNATEEGVKSASAGYTFMDLLSSIVDMPRFAKWIVAGFCGLVGCCCGYNEDPEERKPMNPRARELEMKPQKLSYSSTSFNLFTGDRKETAKYFMVLDDVVDEVLAQEKRKSPDKSLDSFRL